MIVAIVRRYCLTTVPVRSCRWLSKLPVAPWWFEPQIERRSARVCSVLRKQQCRPTLVVLCFGILSFLFRSFSFTWMLVYWCIALAIHVVPARCVSVVYLRVSQHKIKFPQDQESVGNIPFVTGMGLMGSLSSTVHFIYVRISAPSWHWGILLSFRPYIIPP